jgi:two-component system, OmpR family, alkaline phosphatase synthesis response regulator PhoP
MGQGKDILVIDDDRDLVNTIRIVLESRGYDVRTGYNGKEGYARIQEKLPDLIVLDVMMATDTEGFDLAYKLRNNPEFQNIPIVMATAFPQKMAEMGPEKFQHILGEGWPVSEFLEKPIDPETLLSTVESFLGKAA